MDFCEKNGGVLVTALGQVNTENIFDNGQCFRFVPYENGYRGVAFRQRITVSETDDGIYIYPCSMQDFENIWYDYLDFGRDYSTLFDCGDEVLSRCISQLPGLRVLRQDPFETLISFIISANNNIKRIRGIIEKLCDRFGDVKEDSFGFFHCFPEPEVLAGVSLDEFAAIGAGYRASYIKETAVAVNNGFSLDSLRNMDYFSAKKVLCTLKGVGPKVADCILLFSLGHTRAFPVDVWIKRVLKDCYGFEGNDRETADFVYAKFGDNAGIAQQYLFKNALNE